MAIVKQYRKDTDTTYVYESTSYWDPEKKQSRAKRHLIGKLDPVTGEIVPTGKKGRPPKDDGGSAPASEKVSAADADLIYQKRVEISALKSKVEALEAENRRLNRQLETAVSLAGKIMNLTE